MSWTDAFSLPSSLCGCSKQGPKSPLSAPFHLGSPQPLHSSHPHPGLPISFSSFPGTHRKTPTLSAISAVWYLCGVRRPQHHSKAALISPSLLCQALEYCEELNPGCGCSARDLQEDPGDQALHGPLLPPAGLWPAQSLAPQQLSTVHKIGLLTSLPPTLLAMLEPYPRSHFLLPRILSSVCFLKKQKGSRVVVAHTFNTSRDKD